MNIMSTFFNFIKIISLLLVVSFIQSCGKKTNEVDSNVNPRGVNTTTAIINNGTVFGVTGFTTAQTSLLQKAYAGFTCTNNTTRLVRKELYHTTQVPTANGNNTTIGGTFTKGAMTGTVSNIYIGTSRWNDLLFVAKMTDGVKVTGFNIIISMCTYLAQDGTPYIADVRLISNFAAPNQIILDEDNHCGAGSVDSAKETFMQSAAYSYTVSNYKIDLPAFDIWTTFYQPNCSGTY